jgi:NAD(P) transhydrogenase subunit alpha
MIVGIPRETFESERRVALTPAAVAALKKIGLDVQVQAGAGEPAGFPDQQYREQGATVVDDRTALFAGAEVIAQVRTPGANPRAGVDDLPHLKPEHVLLGHAEPLTAHEQTKGVADTGATLLALELVPRITRAQSMDVLSSQANLGGYKAVLLAADALGKIFPMMMTAAGTLKPARVFVIGAGVAGLQAIATAKRLGAVVSATDVRPATKQQVESLGGHFVFLEELMTEGEGGYATELTPEQQEKQRELVADAVANSDVVITTAAIPGHKAPVLVTADTVTRMRPGSVIVDMAADHGGNCELTKADHVIEQHGVQIIGTTNLPSLVATDASAMYSGNVVKLLTHLVDDGKIELDISDEITAGIVVTRGGEVVHPRVRAAMGLPPLEPVIAGGGSDPEGDSDSSAKPQAADERSDTP